MARFRKSWCVLFGCLGGLGCFAVPWGLAQESPPADNTSNVTQTAPNIAGTATSTLSDYRGELQLRERMLLTQLQSLSPSDPDFRDKAMSINTELRDIRSQMLMLRTNAPLGAGEGEFGMVPGQPFSQPPQGGEMLPPISGGFGPPHMGPMGGNPASMNGMPFNNAGGMGQMPQGGMGMPPQGFPGMHAPMNQGMPMPQGIPMQQGGLEGFGPRERLTQRQQELSFQLNQLDRTLGAIGPQDAALAAALTEQKGELSRQLEEVNRSLGAASAGGFPRQGEFGAAGFPQVQANPFNPQVPNPFQPEAGSALGPEGFSQRVEKVNQAATLLRQAGLAQLANHALNQAANLSNPNFVEAPISGMPASTGPNTPGSPWYNPGAADAQNLAELKADLAEVLSQLSSVQAELKNIDTQLKLLSRQSVEPAPAP